MLNVTILLANKPGLLRRNVTAEKATLMGVYSFQIVKVNGWNVSIGIKYEY